MSSAKFYVIHIIPKPEVSSDDIKVVMNKALDWYQASSSFWVVYSTSDAKKWYARLTESVKDEGFVFICELDIGNRAGWMKKTFWEWLNKER